MDIKLMKNSPSNNAKTNIAIKLKSFMIIGCVALFILIYTCIYKLVDYTTNYNTFTHDNYMKNEEFINTLRQNYVVNEEIIRYAKNLNRFYIYHRDFKITPDEEKVSDEDIAQNIRLLENDLAIQQESSITFLNNVLFNDASTESEREQAIENFIASMDRLNATYAVEIDSIRNNALNEIKANYEGIENYLNTTGEFTYYITDSVIKRTFTNIKEPNINYYMNNEVYFRLDLAEIEALFNGVPLNKSFAQNGIEGYIMIPYEQPASSFIQDEINFILLQQEHLAATARSQIVRFSIILAVCATALILLLKSLINIKFTCGIGIFDFSRYAKIPFILKLFSIILAYQYLRNFLVQPFNFYIYRYSSIEYLFTVAYFIVICFMGLIMLYSLCYMIQVLGDISLIKNEPEFLFIKKSITDYSIMRKYSPYVLPSISFMIMFGSTALAFIAFVIVLSRFYNNLFFAALTFILLTIACSAIICLKIIINYAKLGFYIDNLAEGNIVDVAPEKGMFTSSINKLNHINSGLKKTLDEMLKSERTKTELITNVSHDLKTPLTSIINYIELLKRLPLTDPAKEYAEILSQKSQRLKILIEDLFEAAKLGSNSTELVFNKVDVVQLIEQTIGELSEKIEKSQLDFRVSPSSEHIYLLLDGQKMWRVFDNLLTNILKYAKKDTRVYITISESDKTVDIVMKNISAYELDFDASELFERFKRGDRSRTTEGSGLGLSIAQNIVHLHGGKLDISIDGDLFKTDITLMKNIEDTVSQQLKGRIL